MEIILNGELKQISGRAMEIKKYTFKPDHKFLGTKLVATDTGETAGCGTRIIMMTVGGKPQRPMGGGILSLFFNQHVVGNYLGLEECKKDDEIELTVSFISPCTFEAQLFGEIVI